MNLKEFFGRFGMSAPACKLIHNSYFIISDSKWLKHNPVYIGECVAHQRGEKIVPSVSFLQMIGRQCQRKVVVNERGEWLFICGRDLFARNIIKTQNVKERDIVVVLNRHKECIGYGKVVASFTSKRVVIKRLFDIGDLLRREKRRKP